MKPNNKKAMNEKISGDVYLKIGRYKRIVFDDGKGYTQVIKCSINNEGNFIIDLQHAKVFILGDGNATRKDDE